MTIKIE